MRIERFVRLFAAGGVNADPLLFSPAYLANLARGSQLLEGAEQVVKTLHGSGRVRLALATKRPARGAATRDRAIGDRRLLLRGGGLRRTGCGQARPAILRRRLRAHGSAAAGDSLNGGRRPHPGHWRWQFLRARHLLVAIQRPDLRTEVFGHDTRLLTSRVCWRSFLAMPEASLLRYNPKRPPSPRRRGSVHGRHRQSHRRDGALPARSSMGSSPPRCSATTRATPTWRASTPSFSRSMSSHDTSARRSATWPTPKASSAPILPTWRCASSLSRS